MKFRSNNCVAIHVPDLKKAEAFYSGVMHFRLASKSPNQLDYDTGKFSLSVHKSAKVRPPIPSFTVINLDAAKEHLSQNGCEIIEERVGGIYFKDPLGMVYHVVAD